MKLSKAAKIWIDYHKTHSKINLRYDPTSPSSYDSSRNSVMILFIKASRNTSSHF